MIPSSPTPTMKACADRREHRRSQGASKRLPYRLAATSPPANSIPPPFQASGTFCLANAPGRSGICWLRGLSAKGAPAQHPSGMKRLRILRRWFTRKFGYARLVCLALLIGFAALRMSRSGADPGIARPHLRHLPGHRSPGEDGQAGHHRRYRREEPGRSEARSMAVAAHADRRHRHQSDPARRRRHRLRRRVLRAGPAQSGYRRRHLPRSRRGDPGKAARAAEQRPDLRRRHPPVARGARRIRAGPRSMPSSTRICR